MQGVNAQAAAMRSTMGQVQGVTQQVVSPVNDLTTSIHRQQVGWTQLKSVVTNQRAVWENQQRLMNSTGRVMYDAAGNARVMFDEMGGLGNQTLTTGKRVRMFNTVLAGSSKSLVKWGKNTQWAGRQLTVGFTVPLMLLGRTASNAAEEYDRAMTRVVKVTNFSAEQGTKLHEMQMESVREQTRALTEFGATMGFVAEETASTMGEFAQMGYQGLQLDKLSDAALQLSFTTGSELKTSIEATRIAAQAFGIELDDLNEEFARLNIVENNSALSVSETMLGLPVVGAVAKSVGMTLQETNGIMAMMKNAGISAKEGATALRTGLLQLVQDATDPTISAFEKIGLDIQQMKHEMQTVGEGDPLHFFQDLSDHMEGIDVNTEGGQAAMNDFSAALSKLFGVRQTARILSFMEQFNERTEEGTAGQRAWMGVTEDTAEVMRVYEFEQEQIAKSAAGTADRLRAELNVELAQLGERFLEVANKLREFAVSFMNWFNNLDEGIQRTVTAGLGLIAVLGPLIMLAGLLGNGIGNILSMLTALLPKMQFVNASIVAQRVAFAGTTAAIELKKKGLAGLTIANLRYAASSKKAAAAAAAQAAAQQATHFAGPKGLSRGLAAGAGGMGRAGAGAINATGAGGIAAQMGGALKGGLFAKGGMLMMLPKILGAVAATLAPVIAGFAALAAIPILANPGAFIQGFKDAFMPAFDSLMEVIDRVKEAFSTLMAQFRSTGGEGGGLAKMAQILGSIAGIIGRTIVNALTFVIGLLNPIIEGVSAILNIFSLIADAVMIFWHQLTGNDAAVEELAQKMQDVAVELLKGIGRMLMGLVASAADFLAMIVDMIPGLGGVADKIRGSANNMREWEPLASNFNNELNKSEETLESIISLTEELKDTNDEQAEYVQELIDADIIRNRWSQESIENGRVKLSELENELASNQNLTDEMRIQLQMYVDNIRRMREIEDIQKRISDMAEDGITPEDLPEWVEKMEDIHEYNRQIKLGNIDTTKEYADQVQKYADLVLLLDRGTELSKEEAEYREQAAEKLGYSVDSTGEIVDDMGEIVDDTELLAENMQDANQELEQFVNTMVGAVKSNMTSVMSDVASAVKQTLTDEREASAAVFSDRMDNIKDEFAARGDALKERIDLEKEKFKEAHDRRKEQMKERHTLETENLKERHELEMERLEERRQRERDAIEDVANRRIEAIEGQQEAEDDAERQRERAFEREKARINYLHGMRTGNINMQLALARGELSSAAIMREQMGTDTAQFHADSASRERGWKMEDRKAARDAEIGMIKETLDARLEAFDTETKRLQETLTEQQKQRERAQEISHQSQEKALERQNKAQQKALDKRHQMMEDALRREQDVAERRVQMEQEAAEAGFKAREIAIENTLRSWQRTIPKTEKEYEDHLKRLKTDLGESSVDWSKIIDNYGTYTERRIGRGFNDAVDNAQFEMGENAKWEKFGKAMMADLGNGMSSGFSEAFREVAEMLGLDLPKPNSQDSNYPNRGKGGTATSRIGGQAGLWHSGGDVYGPSAPGLKPDEVPAVLQTGEYVIQRDAVKAVGGSFLEEINNAHKMRQIEKSDRYHKGGEVDWQSHIDKANSPFSLGKTFGQYMSYLTDHGARPGFGAMGTGNLAHLPDLVAPDRGGTWRYDDWRTGMNPRAVGIISAILNAVPGGQVITSGFRPGAITSSGNPSQHGAGMAVDVGARARREGGTAASEREGDMIAQAFRSHPEVGQVLWKTMTGGNHYDHVHAGFKFHQGGLVEDMPDFLGKNFTDDMPGGIFGMLSGAMFNKLAEALTMGATDESMLTGAPNANGPIKKYAKELLASFGWSSQQWGPLHNLVQRESSWNPNAQNPTSSAYGLFQFLDSTWAGVNMPKTSNPHSQVRAGYQYIKDRYGSPARAWDHWQRRVPIGGKDVGHWYHSGGEVKMPQLAKGAYVNYDNTVANLHKGETVLTSDLSDKLDRGINRMAAGDSFGDMIVQIENFHGTEENIEKLATRLEQIQDKRSLQRGAKRRFG